MIIDGHESVLGFVRFMVGSVNGILCTAMQLVMESIRTKYLDQVSVLFYDVLTEEGQPFGQ